MERFVAGIRGRKDRFGASGSTTIHDAGAAAVSYPEFFSVLESLRA